MHPGLNFMQIPAPDTPNHPTRAPKSNFPFSPYVTPTPSTIFHQSKPISLQNPSQKMDFGLKFPILMLIAKMVGSQPTKSRILCKWRIPDLLEWSLDRIPRQEKSGFPANMPAGAFSPPEKSGFPANMPAGFFSLRKVQISRQHARVGI